VIDSVSVSRPLWWKAQCFQTKFNQGEENDKFEHKQAVAVNTRINAGGGIYKGVQQNHNETVAVKTRVNAGLLPAV
jgi:hypothetical protein